MSLDDRQKMLGEILLARGKVASANLDRSLKVQEAYRADSAAAEKIGAILTRLGMVSSRDLTEALAHQRGWTIVQASEFPELPVLEEVISPRFIRESRAIPLTESEDEIVLAMTDPADTFTVQAFGAATRKRVNAKLLALNDFDDLYERLYGSGKSSMGQIVENIFSARDEEQEFGDIEHLKDLASEAPVIRLVNLVINHALERRASDIHIEPFENRLILRYRVDGVLHETESPPRRVSAAGNFSIQSNGRPGIRPCPLPPDWRVQFRPQWQEIDLRVSTVPTMHGESA